MKKERNPKSSKKSTSKRAPDWERELLLAKEQVARLNQELEETNAGVVALYAELEEKAEQLRLANEMKTRFLSVVNHEIRTPINSILSLSRILLDRLDGDLTAEQEKQVEFIRKAGQDLSELVNGLLDIAKIEAGKVEVKPTEFEAQKLFGTLEGMMSPLNVKPSVSLVFEEPSGIHLLKTDEHKVNQILRNLISNALKFTEQGEVRVSAKMNEERDAVIFTVADTGIGIKPEDQERIFEEFTQLEGHLQRQYKGTGLGLPLSRKLAELLGGKISLTSEPGVGSTFVVTLPANYGKEKHEQEASPVPAPQAEPIQPRLLVISNEADVLPLYEQYLADMALEVMPAVTLERAQQILKRLGPAAIMLHIHSPKSKCWDFLSDMKKDAVKKHIPVLVVSSGADRQKALSSGADGFFVKPVKRAALLDRLREVAPAEKILIIDDEEASRYSFKKLLASTLYTVIGAESGAEGLRLAKEEQPALIVLDIIMPGMSGFETLERLQSDPATREIPVLVYTAHEVSEHERKDLELAAVAVLSKNVSRETLIEHIREALAR